MYSRQGDGLVCCCLRPNTLTLLRTQVECFPLSGSAIGAGPEVMYLDAIQLLYELDARSLDEMERGAFCGKKKFPRLHTAGTNEKRNHISHRICGVCPALLRV